MPQSTANTINDLRAQVERCQRLARGLIDRRTSDTLNALADEYAARVRVLEEAEPPPTWGLPA
jgi:hypothetical protein